MFRRNNKTRKYQSPKVLETEIQLERMFCLSAFQTLQVDQLHNINADSEALKAEEMYFEF
jgi:hypothetical protein